MKIIWMNGGLGNQAFQYIFLRYMEIMTGDVCYIDDSYFFQEKRHNGYELERIFGIKANRLSEYFEPEVWKEIVESTKSDINIVDLLRSAGMEIGLLAEGGYYMRRYSGFKRPYEGPSFQFEMNAYEPRVTDIEGDLYCHGYWINARWFDKIRGEIFKDFTFPEIIDEENKSLQKMLLKNSSVGIHVRRGDFIATNWALSPEWYARSVAAIRSRVQRPAFYIFSDDLDWCRENFRELGLRPDDRISFVGWNRGEDSYRDMQLMSLCKGLIIANSSFSYLAALLNQRKGKIVLNPTSREIV